MQIYPTCAYWYAGTQAFPIINIVHGHTTYDDFKSPAGQNMGSGLSVQNGRYCEQQNVVWYLIRIWTGRPERLVGFCKDHAHLAPNGDELKQTGHTYELCSMEEAEIYLVMET